MLPLKVEISFFQVDPVTYFLSDKTRPDKVNRQMLSEQEHVFLSS
jgi:hypothetical protein